MSQIRVATTDDDYRDVNALLRSVNMPESELTFPTLLARQGDELVGALGTSIYGDNQAILAGPLVLRADKRRPLLAFKLMSHYERAMMHLGIRSVILWAETGGDLERAMMKATDGKMTPYAVRDGRSFFIWHIGGGDGSRSAATNAAPKARQLLPDVRPIIGAKNPPAAAPTLADVLAKTNIPSARRRANSYRSA